MDHNPNGSGIMRLIYPYYTNGETEVQRVKGSHKSVSWERLQ